MKEKMIPTSRISVLVLVTLAMIALFLLRIFNLQILQGIDFLEGSGRLSTHSQVLEPQRGLIYDRNGEPLVFHEDYFAVYVLPNALEDEGDLAKLKAGLVEQLGVSESYINRRLAGNVRSRGEPIFIRDGVTFNTISYFASHRDDYASLQWELRPKRVYAEDAGIAHILGYVAEINEEELQVLYNDGYRRGDRIGKSGVEQRYDRFLRGTQGRQFFMVDARGQRIRELEEDRQLAQDGSSIYLTIDMNLQRLAYDALAGRRGSVLVLKPATGEILAMVSNPVFNANTFAESGARGLSAQIADPNFPFINRTISALYPPASTFKVITHATIQERTTVSPEYRVHCKGFYQLGNALFRDHTNHGGGWQNLGDALANSCNVYFWSVANDFLSKDGAGNHDPIKITETAKDFGLGALTDVDLPGERSGLIPDKAWKEDTFNSPWVGGDTLNMAIGQGFVQVTPLQMANVTAMVANRGVVYKPHVVGRINNTTIGLDDVRKPEVLHQSSISQQTWSRLAADMRGTVLRGTGWVLTKAATVAGKTGTGETGIDRHYHDWFIAYAPYEVEDPNERIVVVVQIEANDNYQWWSSKIADFVIQGYFAKQNYHEVLRTLRPWYINWRAITGDSWSAPRSILPSTTEVLTGLQE